ncbi:hypothetical protein CCAX7_20670 [Capsulimonas corticalis]|uniref:Uncharacterized protein n=1 Tax=Capsulimonas corticalis TaxID=2219043 RepID=A0A402D2A2_9BACT|nr:hypothetical protein [Capsulimonas corticalis]BDI30016.1 hypothetical protein CCAX7_20670 [Capsulimonas corticalis]
MKLIADIRIELPYALDFCAQGPDLDPLICNLHGANITLFFPPSLSDGTDGQGLFGDWAWWKGTILRLVQEREVSDIDDVEALREIALETGDEIVRRFINSYRWRLARADIYPVRLDPRKLIMSVEHDDGTRETLAEPISAFFYKKLPKDPPLETSVNSKTLAVLQGDVAKGVEPSVSLQLDLDAEALDGQGEYLRAELIRGLARQQMD